MATIFTLMVRILAMKNALKPRPEKCIVLLDRPQNAHISMREPTPVLATLSEHIMRRLQVLISHPAEDSLSRRMRNHGMSRRRDTV